MSGKPGAGAEEEGGCAEAAVLAMPGASPPTCAARSQPPQRPQFPKQRQQALLPPMPRLRVDDSLPPPELHLQALIDACHDAQLPRAGAGERTDGVLLGMPCRMASLAQRPVPQQHIPRERGHSQHGLALLSHRAAPIELLWAGKAITEGGHSSSERDGARDEQRILQWLLASQKSVAQQYEQGTSPWDLHHCSAWL